MGSKEEETQRLLTPSLNDVRTYQIGKFLDYSLSVSGGKKSKTVFRLKSVVHPQWFEHHHTTQQMDLYLSEKALAFLLSERKVSGRWTRKRKWRKKENQESGKGEWYYKYRTPKGTTWIAASQRSSGQKGKPGRKPGGDAYKVRRDTWRIFAGGKGRIARLLEDSLHEPKEQNSKKKFPIRLPNLSVAVEELIISEIWPELIYNREHLVNSWLNLRGVRSYLLKHDVDSEACHLFSKGLLEVGMRDRIIHLICQKHWRKILVQWIELEIFARHLPFSGTYVHEITNLHQHTIKEHVSEEEKSIDAQFIQCYCRPGNLDLERDSIRGETFCKNCGFVVYTILSSVHPVTHEEQFFFLAHTPESED